MAIDLKYRAMRIHGSTGSRRTDRSRSGASLGKQARRDRPGQGPLLDHRRNGRTRSRRDRTMRRSGNRKVDTKCSVGVAPRGPPLNPPSRLSSAASQPTVPIASDAAMRAPRRIAVRHDDELALAAMFEAVAQLLRSSGFLRCRGSQRRSGRGQPRVRRGTLDFKAMPQDTRHWTCRSRPGRRAITTPWPATRTSASGAVINRPCAS